MSRQVPKYKPNCPDTWDALLKDTKLVSTRVVSEDFIDPAPPVQTRYVETPVVQYLEKIVPIVKLIERVKIVPRVDVRYVEKIVEVPVIEYFETKVDDIQYQDVIKEVVRPEFVDVPVAVLRKVPKIQIVDVIKNVDVPGEIIQVDKPYVVDRVVKVDRFIDSQVGVIVAQVNKPVILETNETIDVETFVYKAKIVDVDIPVCKPIPSHISPPEMSSETHVRVDIPAAQYNTILRNINSHLTGASLEGLPFRREADGRVLFLADEETPNISIINNINQNTQYTSSQAQYHTEKSQSEISIRKLLDITPQPGRGLAKHADGLERRTIIARPRKTAGCYDGISTCTSTRRKGKESACCACI